jgi:hypothetical protein
MCDEEKKKKAPPLPDNAPGVNKFRYKQQYGVVVVCADEEDHKRTYASLAAQGYKCRAVRV